MNTVLIWLLVSLPTPSRQAQDAVNVVERFATVQECQRVENIIRDSVKQQLKLRCIQATVVIEGAKK